jgi:GT2 family glycosyltransferase
VASRAFRGPVSRTPAPRDVTAGKRARFSRPGKPGRYTKSRALATDGAYPNGPFASRRAPRVRLRQNVELVPVGADEMDAGSGMSARVTIIVTPWQHFSCTRRTLESLLAFTPPPFELIYVDGNSPPPVRRYLQEQAARHHFTLIRSERYLTTSEAHNAALPYAGTEYVVLLDNCTLVTPGWLTSLVRCADETGAWVAGPLYCMGNPEDPTVFSAGPDLAIVAGEQGERRLHETAPYAGRRLADVRVELARRPCGYAKSYCMLVRREVIDRVGGLDARYTSFQEHRSFCLAVAQAGGRVLFEPESVVMLLSPPPFAWSDLPLFLLRWSDAWLRPSLRHFVRRWELDESDPVLTRGVRFRDEERRRLLWPVLAAGARLGGWRGRHAAEKFIDAICDRVLEPTVIARLERRRQAHVTAAPRVVWPVRASSPVLQRNV